MEKLQTGLYTEIDGVHVQYGQIFNFIAPVEWSGIIYFIQTASNDGIENHEAVVEKMARQFESQSYDHGSEWRESKRELILSDGMVNVSLVFFRIRDPH